jgi:hypothetical protein
MATCDPTRQQTVLATDKDFGGRDRTVWGIKEEEVRDQGRALRGSEDPAESDPARV